ncbi:MAG: DUF2384 domain-containing protein [Aquimonas sp.]|nr:DUF2384 domain-containing protein [Aquimonas sp.]
MPIRPRIQPLVGSKRTTTAHATEPGKTVADRGAVGTASKIRTPVKVQAFRALLRNAPLAERVAIERDGVPFQVVQGLIAGIGVSSVDFQRYVRMPKATFTKKMKEKALFSGTSGQSVVGLLELINKVEDMLLAEPGDALAGFDVEKWVGQWIQRPQPALGGMAPADLMDTPSGRESVMRVLGAIQSGAYQ